MFLLIKKPQKKKLVNLSTEVCNFKIYQEIKIKDMTIEELLIAERRKKNRREVKSWLLREFRFSTNELNID